MAYRVELTPDAHRELMHLPAKPRRQVMDKLESLADDPTPPQSRKLSGPSGLYRIRSGDYRIVYAVRRQVLLVLVVRVGHRKDVYRRLPGADD